MFATMRRKSRSQRMKNELGQSVDHFRRAASLAARETGATVGPRVHAAVDRVQPAAAKARGAASSGWDSALAALTPLVDAATENVRLTGKMGRKAAKKAAKENKKSAKKLQKRADKAVGRSRSKSRMFGFALLGTALGVGAAYAAKRRRAAQWDEYEPAAPTSSTQVSGADDAAFEPVEPVTQTTPNGTVPGTTQQSPR